MLIFLSVQDSKICHRCWHCKSRGFWKEPPQVLEKRGSFWLSSFLETLEIKRKFENYPVTHLHFSQQGRVAKKRMWCRFLQSWMSGREKWLLSTTIVLRGLWVFFLVQERNRKPPTLLIEIHLNVDRKQDRRFTVLLNKKKCAFLHITATQPGDSALDFCAAITHRTLQIPAAYSEGPGHILCPWTGLGLKGLP